MTTWEEFAAANQRRIATTASSIFGRWRAPLAVSAADIEQEMLLGAWLAWGRWEAGRGGMSRETFALCAGRLAALRWLHEQRNAPRRSGKAPGRFPVTESTLGDEGLPEGAIAPGQDAVIVFAEVLREALRECRAPHERRAIIAWVRGGGGVENKMVVRAWRRKEAET